jgi:Protein of unknown function (DUF2484)
MSASLVAACLWLIAATSLAVLPVRRQMVPGIALGVAGLGLIVWIGVENGWGWSLALLLAAASLGRNGIRALVAHLRGEKFEVPEP